MCFLTIYITYFSLNNINCFNVINKKVKPKIKIELDDIVLINNKLGFYY